MLTHQQILSTPRLKGWVSLIYNDNTFPVTQRLSSWCQCVGHYELTIRGPHRYGRDVCYLDNKYLRLFRKIGSMSPGSLWLHIVES